MKAIMYSTVFLLMFATANTYSQSQANMLSNWQDDDLVETSSFNSRYNDVWGYANNGHEFAIIGSTEAIHILDVTDPTTPTEVQRIEGSDGGFFLSHRDMKVYQDYLYCVADEGSSSTLQIIDLSMLPDTAVQVYSSNEFVVTSHNMFIDTPQARLYIVGKGNKTTVLDISNPAEPVFMATYPQPGFQLPYVHDAYVENNIGFMNCANSGLWMVDFTDAENPIVLGTMTDYQEAGYNHSGWLSEDGQYYFLCDENHGSQIKVVNVTDPTDLKVEVLFSPDLWENEIPHNCMVKDGLLYLSHYYDGMQVYDISNPLNPVRVAEYDTYPDANEAWYAGNWGIYPFLPSGNILLSDMQYGLFVIEKLPETVTAYLDLSEDEFIVCAGDDVSFEMNLGGGFSVGGVMLEADLSNLQATVSFSPNPAMPGDVVTVSLTDIMSTDGHFELFAILADDGTTNQSTSVSIRADDAPTAISSIDSPIENSTVAYNDINFAWSESDGAESYRLEIATNEMDFENTLVFSGETADNFYTLSGPLELDKQYFWKVTALNGCGESISAVWAFNTEGANSTIDLAGNKITVYPSPAHEYLLINFDQPIKIQAHLELYSTTGQRILDRNIPAGQNSLILQTASLTAGIYWLKIRSEENTYNQRLLKD